MTTMITMMTMTNPDAADAADDYDDGSSVGHHQVVANDDHVRANTDDDNSSGGSDKAGDVHWEYLVV